MDFLLNVCIHYCSFISIFIRDKFSAGIELRNRMEKHRMDEKYRVFFFQCLYLFANFIPSKVHTFNQ